MKESAVHNCVVAYNLCLAFAQRESPSPLSNQAGIAILSVPRETPKSGRSIANAGA